MTWPAPRHWFFSICGLSLFQSAVMWAIVIWCLSRQGSQHQMQSATLDITYHNIMKDHPWVPGTSLCHLQKTFTSLGTLGNSKANEQVSAATHWLQKCVTHLWQGTWLGSPQPFARFANLHSWLQRAEATHQGKLLRISQHEPITSKSFRRTTWQEISWLSASNAHNVSQNHRTAVRGALVGAQVKASYTWKDANGVQPASLAGNY